MFLNLKDEHEDCKFRSPHHLVAVVAVKSEISCLPRHINLFANKDRYRRRKKEKQRIL